MAEARNAGVEIGEIVETIGETIQNEANVKAVFGQPVKLESKTVIPVAVVNLSFGGGGGGARLVGKILEEKGGAAPFGAGGGLTMTAVPVGFLSEKDGAVVYTPIAIQAEHGEELAPGLVGRLLNRVQHAAS